MEYFEDGESRVFNVLYTILGADAVPILSPMVVTGETVQTQQKLIFQYFSKRIEWLGKIKLIHPVLIFPLEICTDTPDIAQNAY